jgi:hypothetical protein
VFDAVDTARAQLIAATWFPSDKAIGFLAASIIPALFWMIVLAAGGAALGIALSGKMIVMTGASIAAFLTVVFAALTHHSAH